MAGDAGGGVDGEGLAVRLLAVGWIVSGGGGEWVGDKFRGGRSGRGGSGGVGWSWSGWKGGGRAWCDLVGIGARVHAGEEESVEESTGAGCLLGL